MAGKNIIVPFCPCFHVVGSACNGFTTLSAGVQYPSVSTEPAGGEEPVAPKIGAIFHIVSYFSYFHLGCLGSLPVGLWCCTYTHLPVLSPQFLITCSQRH